MGLILRTIASSLCLAYTVAFGLVVSGIILIDLLLLLVGLFVLSLLLPISLVHL